ncbi:MAG: iron-sulfur cluster repair di-iron protein [Candidatus Eisenbacteria bacterium]|uniref:Iron-sulfur cluster repair di-iron protein n=1 Tax=Eiseniibacteriota bacterium TaxID=2212470 RepID=A0A7Y2H2G0_UNCEI|nr:iron-sulfur cluster repair di-iron protein [Candidatus Eisenbacteria bacterium]
MSVTSEAKVGDIATQYPLATRVFARHGIDFCCGGGKPIAEVCTKAGLDVSAVLAEIESEITNRETKAVRWDERPLNELIEHILSTHHRPLDEELPRLQALAQKVHDVHVDKAPDMLSGVLSVFSALRTELEQHMLKEEKVLFPMILAGQGAMTGGPVVVMEQEHEVAGAALKQLRALTNNFEVPEGACNSWRALWAGLEAIEQDLHEHIHLENNILFPRALSSGPMPLGESR